MADTATLQAPVVILVEPQLGENIGAAHARNAEYRPYRVAPGAPARRLAQ
jgi:hypothetical protein